MKVLLLGSMITVLTLNTLLVLGDYVSATLTPSEDAAIRPFLVSCRKCNETVTRRTGNTVDGNPIVSDRTRCRGCIVEFREDLACLPQPFPQPQP